MAADWRFFVLAGAPRRFCCAAPAGLNPSGQAGKILYNQNVMQIA
jgi:hypothetical protein